MCVSLQYGATPLMIAVSSGMEVIAATLLNAARPWVNVNAQKPVRIQQEKDRDTREYDVASQASLQTP